MPTKSSIEPKQVSFPSQKEAWEEREAFREYYNEKQAAEYKRRKENNSPLKKQKS